MRDRVGHFKIVRRLGEGGMGIVFAARDERLDRAVAIKMVRQPDRTDARERFWREARAAASLSHPHVCQIHEILEVDGELYIAMELLEGEALAERMARGPLPLEEAGRIALEILSALEALHRQQIVHRDLKPSNVYITPHGVKLLDFGLARPMAPDSAASDLTRTDVVVGTPRYMAPEQWNAEAVDARTDLFALGALLYEALTGSPAFDGATAADVRRAALFDQPPALAGPPAVAAVDRTLRWALSKRPKDRPPDAATMSRALREAIHSAADAKVTSVKRLTRLVVLPFRMLRPDEECDFLRHSLPDAITTSLSGFEALVVRSPWAATRFDVPAPDLTEIVREIDVDLVVVGTILRGGSSLRVSAQLLEVPAGTTVWSSTHQSSVGDVFQLQDSLARQIVESLSLPLAGREGRTLQRDVPASAKAYELYLRGNEVGRVSVGNTVARDLYLEALKLDPKYAPAWAELGRVYRLLGKYGSDAGENDLRAADALHRALELNPELTRAQSYQAAFDVERGKSMEVLERFLQSLRSQRSDPNLLAALVHVCRYVGLLNASIAAHEEARRLDPNIRTSAMYSYWMLGQHERALAESTDHEGHLLHYALVSLGRIKEAIELSREVEMSTTGTRRAIQRSQRAALEGKKAESLGALREILASSFRDPEGLYYIGRTAAFIGEPKVATDVLRTVVEGGYYCDRAMEQDPWLESIREDERYLDIVQSAKAGRARATDVFFSAEGDKLLGVKEP